MRYTRSNKSEQQVLECTMNAIPNLLIFDNRNTNGLVQIRKTINNNPKLFLDAETPSKTINGNYRKVEFRFVHGKHDICIEIKHQNKISNLVDSVYGELIRAGKFMGKYWLVLLGDAYCPQVVNQFKSELKLFNVHNKVKIFSSLEEYQKELKNLM